MNRRLWVRAAAGGVMLLMLLPACRRGDRESARSSATPTAPTRAEESPATEEPSPGGEQQSPGATAGPGGASPVPAPAPTQGAPFERGAIQPSSPGRYTYDEAGNISTGGCGRDGPPPTPTTLTIDPANGNRQQSVRDRRSEAGQGVVATTVLEYRTDGIYLVYLRQEQHSPLFPQPVVTEFEPNPPVLVVPASPKVGQTWQFTLKSKDGQATADVSNTIESTGDTVAAADGSGAPTTRIKRTTHAYGQSPLGQFDINENATSWVSPSARLVLRDVSDSTGTVGTCRIESHIESTLRSANPA